MTFWQGLWYVIRAILDTIYVISLAMILFFGTCVLCGGILLMGLILWDMVGR